MKPDRHPLAETEICAATLWYFGRDVAPRLKIDPGSLRARLGDRPVMSSLIETPLGNAAVVMVPMSMVEIIRDRRLAVDYCQAALDMVRSMGVRYVSQAACWHRHWTTVPSWTLRKGC